MEKTRKGFKKGREEFIEREECLVKYAWLQFAN